MPKRTPKRHRIEGRLTDKAFANYRRYKDQHHLKSPTEVLEHIGMNVLLVEFPEREIQEIPTCKFYSENPTNPDYIKCRKEDYWKILKREHCMACSLYSQIKIPLKRKEKLLQEIVELDKQKAELKDAINLLKEQYKAVNVPELQSDLKSAMSLIDEKNEELALYKTDNEYLRKENNKLKEEQKHFSRMQQQPKVEHQGRIEERAQIAKTVTVEKVVEKIVYKDRLEGLQIICPSGKGFVNLTEECMQKCKDFHVCPYYSSIVIEKKIPKDAKLRIMNPDKPT